MLKMELRLLCRQLFLVLNGLCGCKLRDPVGYPLHGLSQAFRAHADIPACDVIPYAVIEKSFLRYVQ